ncbi:MAG: hypothetical protein DHS20C15_10080 [Planctomycetota bacterium]|nr:MAG: hypothetical protein DHS20C15_10080 [Planctomycetota bacterium]
MNLALLLLAPAFLAGAAALLLQLVWIQRASAALPGVAPAAALVLPALLLAGALGSWVAGRRADAPEERLLRAARWLLAAALGVWFAPWLLELLLPDGLLRASWTRALLGALPAAPAAFALGGLLPWLTRLRADQGLSVLRAIAGSSAAWALGGAVAAWHVQHGLLLSKLDPLNVAAILLAVASLALAALRSVERGDAGAGAAGAGAEDGAESQLATTASAASTDAPAPRDDPRPWWVVCGLGGAVLVGGQALLLRVLAQSKGDSLTTSVSLLMALHLGMALGATTLGHFGHALSAGARGVLLLLVACVALVLPAFGVALQLDAALWLGLPLGFGCGGLLVAAADLQPRGASRLASWIGDLGATFRLGAALGAALVARFVFDSHGLGTPLGLRVLPGALLVAGILLVFASRHAASRLLRAVPVLAAALLVGWAPAWHAPWRVADGNRELLLQREGLHGIVSLVRSADGSEGLQIDGRVGLGARASGALLEQRMGRLAAAMQPGAQRALMLGVGRGHVLAGLAGTSRARIDAVEPNAEVLALGLGVPALIGGRTPPPDLTPVHADARAWLADTPSAYDLIVSDLIPPWSTGAGSLLSVEHFFELRRALADEGVFVQWLPLHQLPWPAFAAVARAHLEAFPNTHVLVASTLSDRPLVALVGSKAQGLPDAAEVNPLLQASSCLPGPNHMGEVFDALLCGAWELERALGDGPRNTLEAPVSEWRSQAPPTDERARAARNFRQLALLAAPMAWSSFRDPPHEVDARKTLGLELQARSSALEALLHARADLAELSDSEARGALLEGRNARERQLALRLLHGWQAFPGHLDLRQLILDRSVELFDQRHPEDAAALLGEALRVRADGKLGAALGGALLELERPADALHVLRQARNLVPDSPSLLLHLARAEFSAGTRAAARSQLVRANLLLQPEGLPGPAKALLALLEERVGADQEARVVVQALPAQHAWSRLILQLLDERTSPATEAPSEADDSAR